MKFELTEPNKMFSSKELLEDLKRVAQDLGTTSVSMRKYKELGNYSPQTLKKRFGSWKAAIKKAGLTESKRSWGGSLSETRIPDSKLINDLKRVSKKLGDKNLTQEDYSKFGLFSSSAVSKRWSGWNNAKEKAGLKIGRVYNSSDEDYFHNLADIWQKLGRQPRYQEVVAPLSKLHVSSYERKYGSWRKALENFVDYMNNGNIEFEVKKTKNNKKDIVLRKEVKVEIAKVAKRTNRTANLRQRFRVMKRDGFKCVVCGASPATTLGLELNIDHVVPWSKGGETVEDNLQTLCQNCNQGKSNQE